MGSWDIAPRYQTDVLIGNWYEERHKYQKSRFVHPSTYAVDYTPKIGDPTDVFVRYRGVLRGGGLSKDMLFGHHGKAHEGHNITYYDQDFNGRKREGRNALPPLRKWDSGTLAWIPEKSDHPIIGESTNFGLLQRKRLDWGLRADGSKAPEYESTYKSAYIPHPKEAVLASRYYPWLNRSKTSKPEVEAIDIFNRQQQQRVQQQQQPASANSLRQSTACCKCTESAVAPSTGNCDSKSAAEGCQ